MMETNYKLWDKDKHLMSEVVGPDYDGKLELFSTGSVDIEGTEIYEGDIIESTDSNIGIHFMDVDAGLGIVFWNEEDFCWDLKRLDGNFGWIMKTHNVKVLGNIYENINLILEDDERDDIVDDS